MKNNTDIERIQTVIIGAGQGGLSTGYHLKKQGVPFVILDANARIGDAWRKRWDSLRLFTPARFNGLDGMPFPAAANDFPTKNEMADYLENYARHFELPVKTGIKVDRLSRDGRTYTITAGGRRIEADHVVIAMASYQVPKVPAFASELSPRIVQLHSFDYRSPQQLQDGDVLIVGAGNSGAEIAKDIARGHRVWIAGRDVGQVPFRMEGLAARLVLGRLVLRGIFHHILTLGTPLGRKARPFVISRGGPLIRVKNRDLAALGVRRVARVTGVQNGVPVVDHGDDGGQPLDVANVIWCTGFHPGFSWIDRPVFDDHGEPRHDRGVVGGEPGLYFVGLHFLYAMSSTMIHGVGRDAAHLAREIARRVRAEATTVQPKLRRIA